MRKNKLRCGDIIVESYYPEKENNRIAIVYCAGIPSKSNIEEIAAEYVKEGFIFFHPKYFGSWESYGDFSVSGSKKTIISFIEALRKGELKTIFFDKFEITMDKIILLGHSFGGSIALTAGAEIDVAGIVALAPVIDYTKQAKDKEMEKENLKETFNFIKKGFEN